MRRLIAVPFAAFVILMIGVFAPASHAQTGPDTAVQEVITRQLDAFKRADGAAAFAFASPTIQGLFGDMSTFLGMVERGYPQIFRSRSAKFLKLAIVDGRLVQNVLIEGADGSVITAAYEMIEIDGQWRINGVSLARGEAA